MTHIPNHNTPEFRHFIADEPHRVFFAPHSFVDANSGMMRVAFPASMMVLGSTLTEDGSPIPTIRVDHGQGPTSLLFATTAAEMRVLAQGLNEAAERMKKAADDLLAATLAKRGGQA